MFDDEIWDEHRWEAYLSESDRRAARRLALFYGYLADHPRPEGGDPTEREQWACRFRDLLLEKGFSEDDPLLDLIQAEPSPDTEEAWEDDFAEEITDADGDVPEIPVEDLSIYRKSLDLSIEVLRWSDAVPVAAKDSTFVHFCASITQIPANLAKGHGIGFEREMIGGNIACVKRSLFSANEALALIRHLRGEAFFPPSRYRALYERLFDIRNDIGIYVQALRERSDLGID